MRRVRPARAAIGGPSVAGASDRRAGFVYDRNHDGPFARFARLRRRQTCRLDRQRGHPRAASCITSATAPTAVALVRALERVRVGPRGGGRPLGVAVDPLLSVGTGHPEIELQVGDRGDVHPTVAVVRATVEYLDEHFRVLPVEEPEQTRLTRCPDTGPGLAGRSTGRAVAHADRIAPVELKHRRRRRTSRSGRCGDQTRNGQEGYGQPRPWPRGSDPLASTLTLGQSVLADSSRKERLRFLFVSLG